MTSDDWMGITLIAATMLFLIMSVLGAVLLTHFLLARLAFGKRVLIAVVGASAVLFLPFFVLLWFDDALSADEAMIIFWGACLAISLVIGWPTAHLATRRLDKLTQFDLETFK